MSTVIAIAEDDLLAVLIEVAAATPATVGVGLRWSAAEFVSSLNLMVAHVSTPVTVSPVHLETVSGDTLSSPDPLPRASVEKLLRTVTRDGTVRLHHNGFAALLNNSWRRSIVDSLWCGEHTGKDIQVEENSARMVAQFAFTPGHMLPLETDAPATRLIWTDRVPTMREYRFVLPDLDGLTVTLSPEAKALRDDMYHHERWTSLRAEGWFWDREVGPHDTYNHAKLAALNALLHTRTEVTADDWHAVTPLMVRSRELRLSIYNAQPHYRDAPSY